jgi:hypothetical protein
MAASTAGARHGTSPDRHDHTPGSHDHRGSHHGHAPAGGAGDAASGAARRPHLLFLFEGLRGEVRGRSGKYLTKDEAKPPQQVPEGTIYTCPMHPQIRQIGPGSCPICGMALELELVSAETAPNAEAACAAAVGNPFPPRTIRNGRFPNLSAQGLRGSPGSGEMNFPRQSESLARIAWQA